MNVPRSLPTPDDLNDAPELSIVAALEAILHVAETAIWAANRELDGGASPFDDGGPQPPRVWIADTIFAHIDQLSLSLIRYRRAIERERERAHAQFEDLPF